MLLKYEKSKYDVPEGTYLARFKGCEPLPDPRPGEPPRVGRDGKVMAPGMAWRFEVAEGEHRGKIADRVTGRTPGPKNIAGRLLVAVTGRALKDGDTVTIDEYVGQVYRVTVVAKENGSGTHVSEMGMVRVGDAEAARVTGTAPAVVRYWSAEGDGPPVLRTEADLVDLVKAGAALAALKLCREGESVWAPAADVVPVLKDVVPF
jgi:hypothetical protein